MNETQKRDARPPRRILRGLTLGALALVMIIQVVPYGRSHQNPAVRKEPPWDSQQTRALAFRACYDCHSNQSVWPWYSHLAPISWLIQHDVDEGRRELNFSEWDTPQREAGEAAKTVQKGEMPLWIYSLIHPHARLSSSERASLIRGLDATMGQSGERRPANE